MFPQSQPKLSDPADYVGKLTFDLQEAHNRARSTLNTSLRRMKRNYDLRILERQYEQGDLVYLLDTAVLKGKCRKLCQPWKGPAVITQVISKSVYRIQLKNAIFVVNHDRVKPCRDRQIPRWVAPLRERLKGGNTIQPADTNVYC